MVFFVDCPCINTGIGSELTVLRKREKRLTSGPEYWIIQLSYLNSLQILKPWSDFLNKTYFYQFQIMVLLCIH